MEMSRSSEKRPNGNFACFRIVPRPRAAGKDRPMWFKGDEDDHRHALCRGAPWCVQLKSQAAPGRKKVDLPQAAAALNSGRASRPREREARWGARQYRRDARESRTLPRDADPRVQRLPRVLGVMENLRPDDERQGSSSIAWFVVAPVETRVV
jgi:hypothetical protein